MESRGRVEYEIINPEDSDHNRLGPEAFDINRAEVFNMIS